MSESSQAGRRDSSWLPLAAAAIIAVVVVGVAIVLASRGSTKNSAGQKTTASGALACPKTYRQTKPGDQLWVPAREAGVKGKSRMVPDLVPTNVVVCAYLGGSTAEVGGAAQVPISGHRELSGNFGPVIDRLTGLKRQSGSLACAAYLAKTDGDDYLIGLTFAGSTVWVSAPGYHCVGSSNGSFDSATNLRIYAAAAYGAGKWIKDPSKDH